MTFRYKEFGIFRDSIIYIAGIYCRSCGIEESFTSGIFCSEMSKTLQFP